MSLRFRLNFMIMLILVFTVGMGMVFVIHNARKSVAQEIKSTVNLAVQWAEVTAALEQKDSQGIQQWISRWSALENVRHLTVRFAERANQSLEAEAASSDKGVAGVPAWFVWYVTPKPIEVRKSLQWESGETIEILIRANPLDEIKEAWGEARGFFALLVLLALLVYLSVHVMLGRAFKSITVILRGLERIENGDYSARLPQLKLPEFSRISGSFNHAATSLETAREENRRLTQRSLAIQEEERRFLAQELHDDLGQSVSAIKVMAIALKNSCNNPDSDLAAKSISEICDHLSNVVGTMMRRLRPSMLDNLGLTASLEDMIETWKNRNRKIQLVFRCDEAVEACPDQLKIHVYRIVQECLTNVVKHSKAKNVAVNLCVEVDQRNAGAKQKLLRVNIVDDGLGFDLKKHLSSFGLLGIRERVESHGGKFCLKTQPGKGLEVNAVFLFEWTQ